MLRVWAATFLLLPAVLLAGPAPGSALAQDGGAGLYAPFPEPSSGGQPGALGLAGGGAAGDEAFRARVQTYAKRPGPASVRAGMGPGRGSWLPWAGALVLVLAALAYHWLAHRRASRRAVAP